MSTRPITTISARPGFSFKANDGLLDSVPATVSVTVDPSMTHGVTTGTPISAPEEPDLRDGARREDVDGRMPRRSASRAARMRRVPISSAAISCSAQRATIETASAQLQVEISASTGWTRPQRCSPSISRPSTTMCGVSRQCECPDIVPEKHLGADDGLHRRRDRCGRLGASQFGRVFVVGR